MNCRHSPLVVCVDCRPELWHPTQEQAISWATAELTARIREAKVYYYKHGISLMPDHEYDALERSLKAINPTAPVLEEVGYDDVLDPHTEVEDLPD